MSSGNSVFKDLESTEEVPEYLKRALVSEVNTIRDTMHVVTHFTEHFLGALVVSLSVGESD
ncbi:hypothetical protein L0657_15245 [Dyadobacter sp. CY345]|uniref:hypothetical protein n=1 Tax=Dyadobacter sp. CY345 TaxID=2909335 RepID=UPI001F3EDECF|nr:hypothetical protein [Dyadobacter sp. CY345]MCF2445324.1 hypothetical protein [Dyadobacter sp. CY345]